MSIFQPVMGTDQKILNHAYSDGNVYFATDSKKIYLDADGQNKISMGGNSSIFYGIMKMDEKPPAEQVDFTFSVFDIEGNANAIHLKIPNENDLILNQDGCFYRVISLEGEGEETVIYTKKLTIAGSGTGNNDGGDGTTTKKFQLELLSPSNDSVLLGSPYAIKFKVSAINNYGQETGNGTYRITRDNREIASGVVKQGNNEIFIENCLIEGTNKLRFNISMDVGETVPYTETLMYTIQVIDMQLNWDYQEYQKFQYINENFNLSWNVSGNNITKTTYIKIDDRIDLITTNQKYTITPSDMVNYGLTHGVHKFEMYALSDISNEPTKSVIKNIIFVNPDDSTPIISCNFFQTELQQYDTVEIPVVIYSKDNINNNAIINFLENGEEVDTFTSVPNMSKIIWIYTPTVDGAKRLTITCGTASKILNLIVKKLNIKKKEVEDYAFRFKASDFTSNNAVQAFWKNNNVTATFSDNFDWVNGGLSPIPEVDEQGNRRQYFCVKAGSTMTINYNIFKTDAKIDGKCFKVIFKATKCKDYDARILACRTEANEFGRWQGLELTAQSGIYRSQDTEVNIPYCEDRYIELELDINRNEGKTTYIQSWLDGIPASYARYDDSDNFVLPDSATKNYQLVIGSPDCDVYIYLIKLYEFHLTDRQHLSNFIMDASNSEEMLNRFRRNDILVDSDNEDDINKPMEISPQKLAAANPKCLVHLYDIDHMSKDKDLDKVSGCSYTQYHGSDEACLIADNVTIRVQGTSSAAYGLAAFNIDSDFKGGFVDKDGKKMSEWAMNENSIPVSYFNTKVNVASCENANNALNAEWYNKFQPYKNVLRCKNKNARDCMEFTPGVLFLIDRNQEDNDTTYGGLGDNVFKDTVGYKDNPYPKMYSICNMGNSKKNTKVFHDTENPKELCVENADNQYPGQFMTVPQGGYKVGDTFVDINLDGISKDVYIDCPDGQSRSQYELWKTGMNKNLAEFRYPDGMKNLGDKEEYALTAWWRLVNWMAHSNPNPKYMEYKYANEEEFLADETRYQDGNEMRKWVDADLGTFRLIPYDTIFDSSESYFVIASYEDEAAYVEDQSDKYILNADTFVRELVASDAPFDNKQKYYVQRIYENEEDYLRDYSNKYIIASAGNRIRVTAEMSFEPNKKYYTETVHTYGYTDAKLPEPVVFTNSNPDKKPDGILNGYKTDLTDDNGKLWQENYEPVLKDCIIDTYLGSYTHDTYEYRMAKMLSECEQYLCMDSIVYHYLFIERHSMVDNVAKNTFWSTEDGLVWNLTKNYDNDTADGIDNSGDLILSYGIEPGDLKTDGTGYFNANDSVWFNFIRGLYPACQKMYNELDAIGAWDPNQYLKDFKEWQATIPEICWIIDYHRKYRRPYELYGTPKFDKMLDGGKKTHQRDQYETYHNNYLSSKYFSTQCRTNFFDLRLNAKDISTEDMKFTVKTYSDCYIKGGFGTGRDRVNYNKRVKRNTPITMIPPVKNLGDATTYIYPSDLYQTFGDKEHDLKALQIKTFSVANGKRLRTVGLGAYEENTKNNTTLESLEFTSNDILEKLYVAHFDAANTALNLENSPGLKILDARDSAFTSISIANNAPLEEFYINSPNAIKLSNLNNLKKDSFIIQEPRTLASLNIDNIDNSEVNSKTDILDHTLDNILNTYKLANVNWILDDESEISYKKLEINNQEQYDCLIKHNIEQDYTPIIIQEMQSVDGKQMLDDVATERKFKSLQKMGIVLYNQYKLIGNIEETQFNNYQLEGIKIYTQSYNQTNKISTFIEQNTYNPNIEYYIEEYNICQNYQNGVIKYYKKPDNGIELYEYQNDDYKLTSDVVFDNTKDYYHLIINVIDRLIDKTPISENNIMISKANSLTGNITITANAYNGNSALELYNKYVHENLFPNINLIFESPSAKLYDVIIKNGNDDIAWSRKIAFGNKIDTLFLSSGPQGALDLKNIYKNETASTKYSFNNKWTLYKEVNGQLDDGIEIDGDYPYYDELIISNIILVPHFEANINQYKITFMADNDEVIHEGIYDYGTPYEEIMPTIIPYKDPTELENKWGIKAAYNFIGYTRVKGSNNIAIMPEIVAIEDTYYAVFEEIQDITTVVHPEWFEYFEYAYDRERGTANTNASNTELSNIITEAEILKYNSGYQVGYGVRPKYTLQGKVTIPSKYNNQNILKLDLNSKRMLNEVNGTLLEAQSNITHIFFESDNHILEVSDDSLNTSGQGVGILASGKLQYFDFPTSLRYINAYTFSKYPFMRLPVDRASNIVINSNLVYIGENAFNSSGDGTQNNLHVYLPGSIKSIGLDGLAILQFGNQLTINIGTPDDLSQLDLNNPSLLNGMEPEKFYQNQAYAFARINFYTAKYDDGSKIVPEDIAGYDPDASYANYLVLDAFRGSIGNLYIGEGSEN